ncbi:metallophosphoesterase [Nocardia callitridis]|uniref:Calcineurin-like phosphoesterase domain-containing protein n=1 Tax=Nocardia callitridis TaxID=648753 RepID=A0ABP9L5E7_9NOCA
MSVNDIRRRLFLAGAATITAGAQLMGRTRAEAVADTVGVAKFGLPSDRELRILLTGDAGTGNRAQWAVADAIRNLHSREPLSLALGLGDNIYEGGPNGPADVQFAEKFENPNAGLDFPWLMVLGNHDNSSILHGDGGWLLRGNDEVEYHAHSPRWWMPGRYYAVRVPEDDPVVEFFVLDLNPLAAYLPPIFSSYWAVDGQFMNEQRAWLDAAIEQSTATWKIACTHHPYLNNGPHGDAGRYEGLSIAPINGVHVREFIEDHVLGKCQFLLSGHDHSLQVLEPTTESKGTRQIVSGAAAKTVAAEPLLPPRGPRHRSLFENYHELGFMVLELDVDSVGLRVFTVDLNTGLPTEVFVRQLA